MTSNPKGTAPLKSRRTLAHDWGEFQRTVIPKGAPPEQLVEMKRAFYSGAGAMFALMTGELDADKEPTDLDVKYISSLLAEIEGFADDIQAGRA